MQVRFRFFVFLLIVVVVLCIIGLLTLPFFHTEYVEVHGTERVSQQTMENLLAMTKDKNIFLVDRAALKNEVEKDPYLIYQNTGFKLPNRVTVDVEERHPQYYLEHLGNYLAVSSQGIVLSASKEKQVEGIPMISGLKVNSFSIGQKVQVQDDIRLIALNRIMEKFEESGLTAEISEIDVTDVVHIYMKSTQGYNIHFGTSDNIERKIEWIYTLFRQLDGQNVTKCNIDVSSPENPSYQVESGG